MRLSKAEGNSQQAKFPASGRIRLLVLKGEPKQCGTGSRSHGGQTSTSLGKVLTMNVKWLTVEITLDCSSLPNKHTPLPHTCLPFHQLLSWQRDETAEYREHKDQFCAFVFQKIWPWQRQSIQKKAGCVRRGFSTSPRLDKGSGGFGKEKSRKENRVLGRLWIPHVELWNWEHRNEEDSPYPQGI